MSSATSVAWAIAQALGLCCGLVLLLLVVSAAYIWSVRRRFAHIPVPTYTNFFLAHGAELSRTPYNHHLVFFSWAQQCGDLYSIYVLNRVILVATSPSLAKEILTNSAYPKSSVDYRRSQAAFGRRFLGNGLVTNIDHADWKRKRQAINPAFHRSSLDKLVGAFNDAADRLMEELDKVADTGLAVSLLDLLHTTTLDVIGRVAFSFDIEVMNDRGRRFPHAIYMALRALGIGFRNPFYQYLPWNWAEVGETRRLVDYIRAKAIRLITDRVENLSKGRPTPDDILNVMVLCLADTCSMEELADEVVTMFVAGQETTANALSFLFIELGRHPEVLVKLRDEVDNVLGDTACIKQSHLAEFGWLTAAFKEALRLYSPVPGTSRETPRGKETVLCGYSIPPKTTLIISFYTIHYLHHKDGYEFRPERYRNQQQPEGDQLDSELDAGLTTYNYLPFSLGQRSCLGRYFAQMEAKILIAKMLQRFNFELDPDQSFDIVPAGTFKPAGGARLFVSRRS